MTRTGFFAGSFDPPTLGHVELVGRAAALVDRLVLGVAANADKRPWLDADTRLALLAACLPDEVELTLVQGLAVDAARAVGSRVLFRGLRSAADADGEIQMARANRSLAADLESVFLVSSAAIGPYSQAVVTDGTVFTSGQVALPPEGGELIAGGVTEQTRQVLANLSAVLEAAGSSLARVVKTTVYLTSMDDFAAMNAVYAEAFREVLPARSTVAVAALPKGARVEIEAVARVS